MLWLWDFPQHGQYWMHERGFNFGWFDLWRVNIQKYETTSLATRHSDTRCTWVTPHWDEEDSRRCGMDLIVLRTRMWLKRRRMEPRYPNGSESSLTNGPTVCGKVSQRLKVKISLTPLWILWIVNLWFESNNSLLNYTHICLLLLPQACILGCCDCHIATLWCLYPMVCHQYQDGYAVVCLTSSSRLVISVMYAVHSTHSQHSTIAMYAAHSISIIVEQLWLISYIALHSSYPFYHCTCIQIRERKESL
jgi:hypothetical protein